MISFKKTFANNWFSITILFILCLSFYNRYLSFTQTEYANGWDSYFYLVQLKSFIEQGYMHSEEWTIMVSTRSTTYYFFRFTQLEGNSSFSLLALCSDIFSITLVSHSKGLTSLTRQLAKKE